MPSECVQMILAMREIEMTSDWEMAQRKGDDLSECSKKFEMIP